MDAQMAWLALDKAVGERHHSLILPALTAGKVRSVKRLRPDLGSDRTDARPSVRVATVVREGLALGVPP
jgi:hypothetical protein